MMCPPKQNGIRTEISQRACNKQCEYWDECLKEVGGEGTEDVWIDTRFKKPINTEN